MDADVLRDYEFGATFAPKSLEVHTMLMHPLIHLLVDTLSTFHLKIPYTTYYQHTLSSHPLTTSYHTLLIHPS